MSDVGTHAARASGALIGTLVASGCDTFVIAPGSRSAPLVLAASRDARATTHVVLDERDAAFFGLGIAKRTGRPAAVITTSGTATANLLPAIVEASQSCVPLIVLTADRPPRLRGTGANQTITQPGLYGAYVRRAVDLPPPSPDDPTAWADEAREAVRASLGRPAGPVHLNLCFDEPLLPAQPVSLEVIGGQPVEARAVRADLSALAPVLQGRGVILAGTLERDAPSIADLARALGWPLIAEPTSGARIPGEALSAGLALLADDGFLRAHPVDIVLQIGAAPTSRPALRLVAEARTLAVLHEPGRPADPGARAAVTVEADIHETCASLASRVRALDPDHRAAWEAADQRARAALDAVLDADETLTELRLARDLAAAVADGVPLFCGSSLPIRDLDLVMAPRAHRVLANRGASGIDGCCATVYGIAAAAGAAVGLIGDLALLHDASGFLWGAAASGATLVVPNNTGGGIFDLLPSAALPEHERLFRTPHAVDLRALASAAGAPYARISRADELRDALRAKPALIEVPIETQRSRAQRVLVRDAVRAGSV